MTTLHSDFIESLPLHESVRPVPRRCIVCDRAYQRSPQAEHRLCDYCEEQPGEILKIIEGHLKRLKAEEAEAMEAWVERQAALPDDIGERWANLVALRTQTEIRLDRMLRGSFGTKVTEDERRTLTEEARKVLSSLQAKIARTRAAPDNPLSPLLKEEEQHKAFLRSLQDQRCRWEMARSDVETIEGIQL